MPGFFTRLMRRKSHETWMEENRLTRCMNLFDLTVLGLGGMIDAGIYVVIGQLAYSLAGPSVIISFLIAAIAALLAGLCYAELSSRITKTGSAYAFAYVTIGELCAFFVAWSMVAEYIINSATVAKGCYLYINSLSGSELHAFLLEKLGWGGDSEFLAEYPDFIAFALVILAAVIIGLGVRESKAATDIVIVINLTVIVFAIVAGFVFADLENWSTMEKFAPNGLTGILLAAPQCFYCLSGFDAVPTASEEALDPRHTVPKAVVLSIIITIVAYLGIIVVLTLMVPYSQISYYAPLGYAFMSRGFAPGYYVVAIGAIASMLASLLASSYAASRLVYSLSYDGLISQCFSRITERSKVPLWAVIGMGAVTALCSLVLNMNSLVELVAIATIWTYTAVAICVLLSRFQADIATVYLDGEVHSAFSPAEWYKTKPPKHRSRASRNYQQLSDSDRLHVDTPGPNSLTKAFIAIVVYLLGLLGFWTSLNIWWEEHQLVSPVAMAMVAVYGLMSLGAVFVLGTLPQNNATFPYMVPMAVPVLSILINTFVSVRIHHHSYFMFIAWILLGAAVYFGYGIRHSTESFIPEERKVEMDYAVVPDIPMGTEYSAKIQQPFREPQKSTPLAFDDEWD